MILGRTADELAQLAAADEQPAYRGKQLMDGVLKGARSIDDIGNVSTSHPSLRAYYGYTLAARMSEGDLVVTFPAWNRLEHAHLQRLRGDQCSPLLDSAESPLVCASASCPEAPELSESCRAVHARSQAAMSLQHL